MLKGSISIIPNSGRQLITVLLLNVVANTNMRRFTLICGAFLSLCFCSIAQAPANKPAANATDSLRNKLNQEQLKEVVISAAKPYITQTTDKITLNVAQSPLAAGGNAWDLILRAPGVTEQNGSISYNGKTVTVLVNGRPTALSGDDLKNMLGNMPANGIDKVDIIPNPSSKYDAQGGSIINIHLLKNQAYGASGSFTAGIGSGRFARGNTGLSLNYRNKSISIYGSYDYVYNRQYSDYLTTRLPDPATTINEQEYEIRTRNNHAYKCGLDYDIDKNTSVGILLRGSVNYRDRSVTDQSVVTRLWGKDSSSSVFTHGYSRLLNSTANVYYKKTLDANGRELTINGDYLDYRKGWSDDFDTHYYDDVGKEYLNPFILCDESPAQNTIRSGTIDYTQPAKAGKWEAGLKTTFTTTDNNVLWLQQVNNTWKTDSGKTNHFVYHENISAAYLNFSKTIKKYSIQLGLRAEQTFTKGELLTQEQVNRRNYFNLFPNVAVQYNASKTQQFGFNYRKSIQRFGFDYINPFIVYHSQYAYSQGNPGIVPMMLHSFELSYSWKNQVFARAGYTRLVKVLGPTYRNDAATQAVISSYGNLRNADVYTATLTVVKSLFKGKWTSTNTLGSFYARYSVDALNQTNAKVTGYLTSNNAFLLSKKIKGELTGYYYTPIAVGVYQQKSMYMASAGISYAIMSGKGALALNLSDIFNSLRIKNDVQYQQVNMQYNNKAETRFVNLVFTWRFGNNKVKAVKSRKTGIEDEKSRMNAN